MIVIDFLKKFEVHSILLLAFLILVRQYSCPIEEMSTIFGVDFEVFGRVQGVFFRKYTEAKAKELKLNGWCMNTKQGTVLGYVEGDKNNVEKMKQWLKHTGSPQSAIDKVDFRNEKKLEASTFNNFSIKK